jgi:hypothetical protein
MDVAYISGLSALAGSVIGGLTSGITTMSSSNIVACAEQVVLETTGAYFEPNRTVPEFRELIKSGTGVDPLKDFPETVREERRQSAHVYATLYRTPRSSDCFRLRGGVLTTSVVDGRSHLSGRSAMADIVKSIGRRRRTKVSEDRTRVRRAVAM